MLLPRRRSCAWPAPFLFASGMLGLTGCASPGAPRPPSLHLPETARDLVALRSGNAVQIRFSAPSRTTDGQSIRDSSVRGELCRQETAAGPCTSVDQEQTAIALPVPASTQTGNVVVWTDNLPDTLREGPPRALSYRVTLKNDHGRSAGPSDPVYVAAGTAPPEVSGLGASGNRVGALLQWRPESDKGEILIERTQVDPKPQARTGDDTRPERVPRKARSLGAGHEPHAPRASRAAANGATWLVVPEGGAAQGKTFDGTVEEGVTYRYVAVRRTIVKLGGRSLEVRSAPSTPAQFTWRDVYPPPAPQQLTGIGYMQTAAATNAAPTPGSTPGYAVDLVWQPVEDARMTGYIVTRQALTPTGAEGGAMQKLSETPVTTPAFHDTTADPGTAYRYAVVSTDARGNTSNAATVIVPASPR